MLGDRGINLAGPVEGRDFSFFWGFASVFGYKLADVAKLERGYLCVGTQVKFPGIWANKDSFYFCVCRDNNRGIWEKDEGIYFEGIQKRFMVRGQVSGNNSVDLCARTQVELFGS